MTTPARSPLHASFVPVLIAAVLLQLQNISDQDLGVLSTHYARAVSVQWHVQDSIEGAGAGRYAVFKDDKNVLALPPKPLAPPGRGQAPMEGGARECY